MKMGGSVQHMTVLRVDERQQVVHPQTYPRALLDANCRPGEDPVVAKDGSHEAGNDAGKPGCLPDSVVADLPPSAIKEGSLRCQDRWNFQETLKRFRHVGLSQPASRLGLQCIQRYPQGRSSDNPCASILQEMAARDGHNFLSVPTSYPVLEHLSSCGTDLVNSLSRPLDPAPRPCKSLHEQCISKTACPRPVQHGRCQRPLRLDDSICQRRRHQLLSSPVWLLQCRVGFHLIVTRTDRCPLPTA